MVWGQRLGDHKFCGVISVVVNSPSSLSEAWPANFLLSTHGAALLALPDTKVSLWGVSYIIFRRLLKHLVFVAKVVRKVTAELANVSCISSRPELN